MRRLSLAAAACLAACQLYPQPGTLGQDGGGSTGSATAGSSPSSSSALSSGSSSSALSSSRAPASGSSSGGSSTSRSSSAGTSGSSGSSATGGSSSGGSSSAPSSLVTVTLTNVGVHPAALAALTALGFTPPSLANGYQIVLEEMTFVSGQPSLTTLSSSYLPAADGGTVTFSEVSVVGGGNVIGLFSAIVGATPGTPPSCSQLQAGPGSFADFYVPAVSLLYAGTPPADVTGGVALALPASYVSLLDCAVGLTPGAGNDLLNAGFALLYASQATAAQGTALYGVTFASSGSLLYYDGYTPSGGSATPSGPTSPDGVATVTGISYIDSVTATDNSSGATFSPQEILTIPGKAYQVFFAPGL